MVFIPEEDEPAPRDPILVAAEAERAELDRADELKQVQAKEDEWRRDPARNTVPANVRPVPIGQDLKDPLGAADYLRELAKRLDGFKGVHASATSSIRASEPFDGTQHRADEVWADELRAGGGLVQSISGTIVITIVIP